MVEVDLSIIFAGLSIAASIVYYASVLRNANKTSKTQLFMQIYEQINSEESNKTFMDLMYLDIEDNEEYLRRYDSSVDSAHFGKRATLFYNFNATMMWEKWEHIIRETRARENLPDLWEGFEYLHNEMKKYRTMKGYPDPVLTPRDYLS
jgi:hypothetical protein